jgi:hypothetical protein
MHPRPLRLIVYPMGYEPTVITFDEAREVVAQAIGPDDPEADFEVAPWGWANDEVYVLLAGTHIAVYGPTSYEEALTLQIDDTPALLVNKETGEFTQVYGLLGEPAAPDLVPIGERP